MRTDGVYVEAGEQDNLIVQKLVEDPNIIWYIWIFIS